MFIWGISVGGFDGPELHEPAVELEDPLGLCPIWIPVIVIGTAGTASMIRRLRANLLDELQKQYVVTARAKGLHPFKVLLKYPLRLALNPFVSDIGSLLPHVISGAAVVSVVMSLPTTGKSNECCSTPCGARNVPRGLVLDVHGVSDRHRRVSVGSGPRRARSPHPLPVRAAAVSELDLTAGPAAPKKRGTT